MLPNSRLRVHDDLKAAVGRTPALILHRSKAYLVAERMCEAFRSGLNVPNGNRIILKLEHLPSCSPTGSLYDRLYPELFHRAEASGRVDPEHTRVIECSVGNAGAAFAYVARALGYRRYSVILPADIYGARIEQVRELGADVVFSPPRVGPRGYVALLEQMLREERGSRRGSPPGVLGFCPISKTRKIPLPPYAALVDEARFALRAAGLPSGIGALVCVVGAGNTISLAGRYVKMLNPAAKVIAAEHAGAPFVETYLEGHTPPLDTTWTEPDFPATTIQGVPLRKLNLELSVIDSAMLLSRSQRESGLRMLNDVLQLKAGRPSGLSFNACLQLAGTVENTSILSIVFDSIAKYDDSWHCIEGYCPPQRERPVRVHRQHRQPAGASAYA